MKLIKVAYAKLNDRQKENYNFHKIASDLAEYGYSCMWLNDDWQGADFIANHIGGDEFLKVQLKGRPTISKKYMDKNIFIAFRFKEKSYLYDHDDFVRYAQQNISTAVSKKSWKEDGNYSWPQPTKKMLEYFEKNSCKL